MVKQAYPSPMWEVKVEMMPKYQVLAIYDSLKTRGKLKYAKDIKKEGIIMILFLIMIITLTLGIILLTPLCSGGMAYGIGLTCLGIVCLILFIIYLIDRIKDNCNIRQLNISLHSYDIKYGKKSSKM